MYLTLLYYPGHKGNVHSRVDAVCCMSRLALLLPSLVKQSNQDVVEQPSHQELVCYANSQVTSKINSTKELMHLHIENTCSEVRNLEHITLKPRTHFELGPHLQSHL